MHINLQIIFINQLRLTNNPEKKLIVSGHHLHMFLLYLISACNLSEQLRYDLMKASFNLLIACIISLAKCTLQNLVRNKLPEL